MNMETHNKYFRDIAYNTESAVRWPDPTKPSDTSSSFKWAQWSPDRSKGDGPAGADEHYLLATKEAYDARVEDMISKCHHVKSFNDMVSQSGKYSTIMIGDLCCDISFVFVYQQYVPKCYVLRTDVMTCMYY
jgi:hypothetical protein